jgi:hypothetical protein
MRKAKARQGQVVSLPSRHEQIVPDNRRVQLNPSSDPMWNAIGKNRPFRPERYFYLIGIRSFLLKHGEKDTIRDGLRPA